MLGEVVWVLVCVVVLVMVYLMLCVVSDGVRGGLSDFMLFEGFSD